MADTIATLKEEISDLKARIVELEKALVKNSDNYNKHMIELHIRAKQ